MLNGLIS